MQQLKQRSININVSKIYHWPTLKTVLMVEDAIRDAELALSIEELKRKLGNKIMDQTLRLILSYLEDKGDINIGSKGIVWSRNDSPEFRRMIKNAKYIEL